MSTNIEGVAGSKNQNVGRGVIAIVLAVVAFLSGELGGLIVKDGSLYTSAVMFLIRTVIAMIPFLLLGGKKWFTSEKSTILKTLKFTIPLLALNLFLAVLSIWSALKSGVTEGAFGRVCTTICLAALIGLNEELIFRGLLFQGIHTIIGKKKSSLLAAAMISALVFGFAHVIAELDFSNIFGILTACLKTLETAMFGFVLCYCCYFFKDIRGSIIFHAIFDWVVIAPGVLSDNSGELSISYTSTDTKKGTVQIIMFLIMVIVYAPCTIKAFKAIKAAEPSEGLFAKESGEKTPAYAQ